VCGESRKHGSEGGCRMTQTMGSRSLPYQGLLADLIALLDEMEASVSEGD
jgi:hypothetical protein